MDRHEKEALDRWITREPEYMTMDEDDAINEWGGSVI